MSLLIAVVGVLVLLLGLTALTIASMHVAAAQYRRQEIAVLIRQLEHLLEHASGPRRSRSNP